MMWYMNEERLLLQKAFRRFAQEKVRPFIPNMEENDEGPKNLLKELARLGYAKLPVPKDLGGMGEDYISWGLLLEELGRESLNFAFLTALIQINNRVFYDHNAATKEQIERYVKPVINGEYILGLASCEPAGGSFFDGYETVAQKEGNEWVINGSKIFITECDFADYIIVCARTKEHVTLPSCDGLEIFVIPTDIEGFSVGHIEHKVGLKGSRTGSIYLDNVRVPESSRLNHVRNLILTSPEELGIYGAMTLGACERVLEQTVDYLKSRVQFGSSLWDAHESMRWTCGRLKSKISAFRNSVYGHLANMTNGQRDGMEALSCKVEGVDLLREVTTECNALYGGMGEIYETGIERFYRDAAALEHPCVSDKSAVNFIGSSL
ncbi:acyl-CoA dehydrogenase family protein [Streptococcus moroccensis]|uniref:Alkylation response protein AidB-like acyl-CoA dehydrogenase n=1 Tax=Streptococcus moroccensis TaxID=1451356 RepID=A0ABT9YVA6_9STRE|nr:acyl-CoA dehydrogenase family protein [Streptococcus moroccensis]MDQ0223263.1 alkylation response protein AidB-like acyl-CoA dehydrogenase [Streptococcus moroccensis]